MASSNSVGTAYLSLVPKLDSNMSELDKGIDEAGKKGGNAFTAAFKKVAGAVAFAEIGKKAADVLLTAFNNYASYEQLTGGVETLFKSSSDTVLAYAENAYQTAGMSANQYMETVTSFSASLISSLDGDVSKSAEIANVAITDMSDNANKMGTSMESIQNAYAGFAKGQFNMLDNLKLGYGGTQEEMKKLLKDAQKLSGIKYDIDSFADIAEAIHVIQVNMDISGYSVDQLNQKLKESSLTEDELSRVAESMGISFEEAAKKMEEHALTYKDAQVLLGTTAKEASTTIEGSINMTKASWDNFLTKLAKGGDNIGDDLQKVVDSFETMVGNVIPVVGNLLESVGTVISENLPTLLADVVQYLGEHAPDILGAALDLFLNIASGLISAIPEIISRIPQIITTVTEKFMSFSDSFGEVGFNLIKGLGEGIGSAVDWVIDKVKELCSNALDALKSFFGIHSPSRVMRQMGGYIGEGLALGIEDSESVVGDAMDGLMSTAAIDEETLGFAAGGSSTINIHELKVNAEDARSADAFTAMLRRASMQYA